MLKKINKQKLILNFKMYGIVTILSAFIIACIGVCAYFFDKWIEATFLLISFFALRYTFIKTYHSESAGFCTFISIAIFWLAIPLTPRIETTIFASVLVGFIICFLCYIVQDYFDIIEERKLLREELENYKSLDLFKMTEQELEIYSRSKKLSDVQFEILLMRIKGFKISEICQIRNYGRSTIKYHLKEIKKKLNIEQI